MRSHGFQETVRVSETTTHGDAIERSRIVGQYRFAFKTPPAQDAFDAQQVAVVVNQRTGISRRQSISFAGKLQRAKCVRLLPTVGQAERLGDEFGIH